MARILLAEDDPDIAMALATMLRQASHETRHAPDGPTALREAYDFRPELVLLDIGLPGMDGWEVLSRIRDLSDVPIVLLTAADREQDKVRGLRSGADDYLTKPFDVDELEARVRTLLRRQAGLKSAVLSHGSITLDLNTRSFMSQGSPLDMPARERSLLETLFVRAGKVVPKQAIIESLASFDDDLSANAIEQYVSRLRKRLAPYGLTVRTARGIGYYLEAAKPE